MSQAAASAVLAAGFVFYTWLTHDGGLPNAASSAESRAFPAGSSTVVAESQVQNHFRTQFGAIETGHDFAFGRQGTSPSPISTHGSFSDRFGFNLADAPRQAVQASAPFDDRFSGAALSSGMLVRTSNPAGGTVKRTATVTNITRAAARTAIAPQKQAPKAAIRLSSASDTSLALSYASADSAIKSDPTGSLNHLLQTDSGSLADVDSGHTAIYDISAHTVYLPNGRRLEAHSGLGNHMDDPQSVASRNTGVTPPNLYELKMRESRFHGVRAIRLIPKNASKMYGRSGMLAHTYMLGPNGQSNGCVSFSDYTAFLDAYERGDLTHLLVVDHYSDAPAANTASGWFSRALRGIFQRPS
jgi:hypothetical protein